MSFVYGENDPKCLICPHREKCAVSGGPLPELWRRAGATEAQVKNLYKLTREEQDSLGLNIMLFGVPDQDLIDMVDERTAVTVPV